MLSVYLSAPGRDEVGSRGKGFMEIYMKSRWEVEGVVF